MQTEQEEESQYPESSPEQPPGDRRGAMDKACRQELPDASPEQSSPDQSSPGGIEDSERKSESPLKSVRFEEDRGKPGTRELKYDRIDIPSGMESSPG